MTLWRRLVCAFRGHRGRPAGFCWRVDPRTAMRNKWPVKPQGDIAWKVCERCGELYGEDQK